MTKSFPLPDDTWVSAPKTLLPTCDLDIWSDAPEYLEDRRYECDLAKFYACIPGSGQARFNWVLKQIRDRMKGEIYDMFSLYKEPDLHTGNWKKDEDFCRSFGKYPRRRMNSLSDLVGVPYDQLSQSLLCESARERNMWLGIARKIYLVRAGYPQFCEQWIPQHW